MLLPFRLFFILFVYLIGTEHINEHQSTIQDVNMPELAKNYICSPEAGNKNRNILNNNRQIQIYEYEV